MTNMIVHWALTWRWKMCGLCRQHNLLIEPTEQPRSSQISFWRRGQERESFPLGIIRHIMTDERVRREWLRDWAREKEKLCENKQTLVNHVMKQGQAGALGPPVEYTYTPGLGRNIPSYPTQPQPKASPRWRFSVNWILDKSFYGVNHFQFYYP